VDPDGTLSFAFENGEEGLEATYLLELLSGEDGSERTSKYDDVNYNNHENNASNDDTEQLSQPAPNQPIQTVLQKKHARLQAALGAMLEDYSLLSLVPVAIDDKMSVGRVVQLTDKCIGYINSRDAVPSQ
jgi:hypothetical protein